MVKTRSLTVSLRKSCFESFPKLDTLQTKMELQYFSRLYFEPLVKSVQSERDNAETIQEVENGEFADIRG